MSLTQDNKPKPALSDTWKRVLLYGSAGSSIFALSVALLMPQVIGPEGFILAFGIAAVLVVVLYGLWSGGAAARNLSPSAIEKLDTDPPFALSVLESDEDALLVYSSRGEPFYANRKYRQLLQQAGLGSTYGRPPAFDRLVGGHPGLSAFAFRLAKAGRSGQARQERLPGFEINSEMLEFDASVSPLSGGQSLLRLTRRVSADKGSEGEYNPVSGTALLDEAPIGFFSANADGKTQYMNDTLRSWLGVSPNAPNPDAEDFIAGDAKRVLGQKGAPEDIVRSEVKLRARDNIETPAMIVTKWVDQDSIPSSSSVVFGNGRIAAPMGVAQALEPAGRGTGQSLDELLDAAPFGVARLDGRDADIAIIEDCNRALVQMTSGAATPGTAFLKILSSETEDPKTRLLQAKPGSATPTEVMLVGEPPRPAHLYLATDRAGRALVFLMDMTGWKDLETQLFQAQKMHAIGKLAGGVAHDFNTLLNVIRLNCDELLSCHPIGDPSFGELQQINQTVNRAKSLVSQLLAFSHQQTSRSEVMDVAEFLSEVSILLKQVLQETVTLELKHARDKLNIRADRRHLETALMNLATNARDAMKGRNNARLIIRTSSHETIPAEVAADKNPPEGSWVVIEVIDTGSGMEEDVLEKIFEPFYTTKQVGSGTGLGLSTVYGIIKQSGGYLHPISVVGEGTNFQLWLPAVDAKTLSDTEQSAKKKKTSIPKKPADISGRGKILFVEDEGALRSIAAKTLEKRGYEVLQAGDGEEALQLAKDHAGSIDLMISDVMMPNMDGPTMLSHAREYLADARIVFISGYAEEEFSDVLSKEEDVSFLPKPFSLEELATKVKGELAG